MDWLYLLAAQGTLKSLLQHHPSKASILRCSAFLTVQLSHTYMTTGKTIALTRQTFVGTVMTLLFNMASRLVITFIPRSKRLLISLLQSPSAVYLTLFKKNKVYLKQSVIKTQKHSCKQHVMTKDLMIFNIKLIFCLFVCFVLSSEKEGFHLL